MIDLTNKRYFFELTTSPNVLWVELAKFKLAAGSSVMVLNPDNAVWRSIRKIQESGESAILRLA